MTQEEYNQLDKCYFEYNLSQECEQRTVPARSLLGPRRFDLYAILFYIDMKVRGVQDMAYPREIYKARTLALTLDTMSEAGNSAKNNFDDFIHTLDALIDDCRAGRWDSSRTLVPVDKDGVLIDGAHRTACAAYFGLDVRILQFKAQTAAHITSQFLTTERHLPQAVADLMALEACRWHTDLFMLFMWPKAFTQPDTLTQAMDKVRHRTEVVHEKEAKMTYTAIRNLMIQIYGHMDWVGGIDNDFAATFVKADEVWDANAHTHFVLLQAPSCDYVLALKAELREMFHIALASCHSTDNAQETLLAANAIYNPNSLHFLLHGAPTAFKQSYRVVERFREVAARCGGADNYVIDSGMVLAMYGVRPTSDLDYISLNATEHSADMEREGFDSHNGASYYRQAAADLVLLPYHHFCFAGLKFVCPERLLEFKLARAAATHDIKDAADAKMLKVLVSDKKNGWVMFVSRLQIRYGRLMRKLKRNYYVGRHELLVRLHLYNFLSGLRRKIK